MPIENQNDSLLTIISFTIFYTLNPLIAFL
jgi:hypothetical protein